MKKLVVVMVLAMGWYASAQNNERVITTAVPFLTIAADGRSAGLGDMGVATPTHAF